jgi:hypothetical protein
VISAGKLAPSNPNQSNTKVSSWNNSIIPSLTSIPAQNTEKDLSDWVSGDDPMTGAQPSYLTTLCEEAKVEAPAANLTKAEASKLIDELRSRLNREG